MSNAEYAHLLAVLSLAGYALAAVGYLCALLTSRTIFSRSAGTLLALGFLVHTILIHPFLALRGDAVLPRDGGEFYFWLAWALPLLYFMVGRRLDFPIIGAFVAPTAAVFLVSSSYLVHQQSTAAPTMTENMLLALHVVPLLVAAGSLFFAFTVSTVFLIQDRRLKLKHPQVALPSGPSLDNLDRLTQRFVLWGFMAMSVAMISGSVWAVSRGRRLLTDDLYQWQALMAWIFLAAVALARATGGWPKRKLSLITASGAGVFMLLLVVTFLRYGIAEHAAN